MQILTDSQTFRCYGCGEYGDVLDLVRLLEGCALFEAMGILASRYGIALESTRPQSWFDRQTRQKPLRDQMRHTQIEHIRMLVYRLIWVPWLKRLPEWVQDEAEESAWRDSLRMAELLYDQRRAA
jgi:CHC2 zinc finger